MGSVAKGFDVLKAFRRGQTELGLRDLSLSEISRLTGMDKSSAQRFTNTLNELGYLTKDPHTRRYRPAVNLVDFYYTYVISNRLAEIAMARLIEAGRVHDTTVNLCELSGPDLVYTIRIPHERRGSKHGIRTPGPGVLYRRRLRDPGPYSEIEMRGDPGPSDSIR